MVFVPRFSESGESEIIDNLLSVIDRDMKAALDHYYLADALPDFATKTLGDFNVFSFPLLVIEPESMTSEETNDGFYLTQDLRIGLGIAILDTSIREVTKKTMKYIRSLKSVLRSASSADLFPASNLVMDHVIDIDHKYQGLRTRGTDYVRPVEFDLKIKFGEK